MQKCGGGEDGNLRLISGVACCCCRRSGCWLRRWWKTLYRESASQIAEREGWNLEMQNNAEMAAAAAEGHTHRYFLMADLMISGKTIGKLETEGAWNMRNSFRCFCCSLFLPSKPLLSFHRLLLEVFLSPHLVSTTWDGFYRFRVSLATPSDILRGTVKCYLTTAHTV